VYKVVSFHTPDELYTRLAERLRLSLEAHGVQHHIEKVTSSGSWVTNCAMKADFCLRMRQEQSGPIVWLDADAIVRHTPDLFEELSHTDVDLATYGWEGRSFDKCISATIYMGTQCEPTLASWARRCRAEPRVWDQIHLAKAIDECSQNHVRLPESYCRIFDARWMKMDPVIEQTQASRVARRMTK
jgi:hypothetical protein